MLDPQSYWLTTTSAERNQAVDGDLRRRLEQLVDVDVLVIGAGMAGLCTAAVLHEQGVAVALVDAQRVGSRTTGHTTAKITALHGTAYQSLHAGRGPDVAAAYAESNARAVTDLIDLIDRWDVSCDLESAVAYTVAATAPGLRAIEDEVHFAGLAGLPVRFTSTTGLPFDVAGAVALDDQAQFHPVEFADHMKAALRSRDVPVIEGVRATDVDEDDDGCTVTWAQHGSTRVPLVVQTTHLPVTDPGFLAARVKPMRSYVVAGRAPVSPDGMYLAADAAWSVRRSGLTDPVCIVGGEGHAMTESVSSLDRYAHLEAFARESLAVDVEHHWSAFDYETVDGVPFIGRLSPRSRRRYVATGFRKWGMTNAMVAATIIAAMIDGEDHPNAHVFDATRQMSNVGRDIVRNGLHVAVRFLGDRVTATAHESPLAPGEGAVVRRGLTAVAVSVDRNGVERELKATCTHLGCLVAFNDAEQTWDCPCHGSRFALDGTVLDGPAVEPLSDI